MIFDERLVSMRMLQMKFTFYTQHNRCVVIPVVFVFFSDCTKDRASNRVVRFFSPNHIILLTFRKRYLHIRDFINNKYRSFLNHILDVSVFRDKHTFAYIRQASILRIIPRV
jgi:hypothetical protein